MSVIYTKIWHELWHNKGRTAQVVLIIAMGAFALGMILGSSRLIRQGMTSIAFWPVLQSLTNKQ